MYQDHHYDEEGHRHNDSVFYQLLPVLGAGAYLAARWQVISKFSYQFWSCWVSGSKRVKTYGSAVHALFQILVGRCRCQWLWPLR